MNGLFAGMPMYDLTHVECAEYQPAFQWFGAKGIVARAVWGAIGDVSSYVEPFFGSGAVLHTRPAAHLAQSRRESINDLDGFVANFWRATKADRAGVAAHCDWPCNEDDLTARHAWLMRQAAAHKERILADPDYYDAKIAGWWCWGQTWWIGGGWCDGTGGWSVRDGVFGRHGDGGPGVSRRRPQLSDDGRGVSRKLPSLSDDGRGVSRPLPHLGTDSQGACGDYAQHVLNQIARLSDRLRRVRVTCGDWARVVTPSAAGYKPSDSAATVGVVLDPPYSAEADRNMGCYATDSGTVAHDVRVWCAAAGTDRRLRIALCGYEGEHDELQRLGWAVLPWKTQGGLARTAKQEGTQGSVNRARERIWFSPACDHDWVTWCAASNETAVEEVGGA